MNYGLISRYRILVITILAVLGVLAGTDDLKVNAVESSPTPNLQQLIDRTSVGGTLVLSAGTYQGNVTVHKTINIQGEGIVQILGTVDSSPVMQIQSDRVRLHNLQLIQLSKSETSAVLITGSKTVMDSIDIHSRSFGIVLRDGGQNEIFNTKVQWEPESQEQEQGSNVSARRNGIDLYNSHDNYIHDNTISTMNDGIYLENSHRNRVENNRIDHSRYGIHCMYTHGTVVRGNIGSFNVTGAMIMGVKDAKVEGNTFIKQSESVNSQGLLLFDVQTSRIYNNKVDGNRVGLYIEQSQRNEIISNEVVQNFIGIQLLESDENQFTENHFMGNVIESEANESQNNNFTRNYWDAFHGIDTSGDGISDIPYAVNPFFQRLTSATPAFQLFFQSPGMLFLESMYTTGKEEWTTDKAPLIKPENSQISTANRTGQANVLILGVLLLAMSITTITYSGVKRV